MNPQDSDDRRGCFSRRKNLIIAFLNHDQGDGKVARAAVTAATSDVETSCPPVSPVANSKSGMQTPPTGPANVPSPDGSLSECRCMTTRADRIAEASPRRTRNGPPRPALAPPAYHGPNPQHESDNRAEFSKRKTAGACFHCPMTGPCQVDYNVFHTMCPTHGRSATSSSRKNDLTRVPGAGSLF